MRRGDVFIADIVPRSGSEQSGRRPVVIVSNDGFNLTENWRSIIVLPLSTSTSQSLRTQTVVHIPSGEGGLFRNGSVLCHQVTTLDRKKLKQRLGELTEARMAEIERGLKAAMDMI